MPTPPPPSGGDTYERLRYAFGNAMFTEPQLRALAAEIDFAAAGGGGAASSITGSFTSDGQFPSLIPGGAVIIGGRVTPNTPTGATISLGTTNGGADVFEATPIPGSANGPTPLQGINFLATTFAANQAIFAHSPSWAPMTIAIWYLGP